MLYMPLIRQCVALSLLVLSGAMGVVTAQSQVQAQPNVEPSAKAPVQPTTQASLQVPVQAIAALDVPRYMGTWFEIAKFPNRFQAACLSDTSAQYSLKDGGVLEVKNRCRTQGGEMKEAIGQARQMGAATSAQLQVRFAPPWLSWLPMVWGNYWVVDLDEGYQLAAVSEPTREFLWILSRSPKPDPMKYAALVQRLKSQGFDVAKLQPSLQAAP